DTRQCLEMIGASAFWRKQQEYQIDGLSIECFEVDRTFEARKHAEQLVELRQLSVRNSNTTPDAGRAELLPLHENLEDRPLAEPGEFRSLRGELLQGLFLAVDLQRRNDRIGRHEIVERHGLIPVSGNSSAGPSRRRTIRADSLAVNGSKARMQIAEYSVIIGSR